MRGKPQCKRDSLSLLLHNPLLEDATMDLNALLVLHLSLILVQGQIQTINANSDLCFDRYDHLQREFCEYKINATVEKLSATFKSCGAELLQCRASYQKQHNRLADQLNSFREACDARMRNLNDLLQQQNSTFRDELLWYNNTCTSTLNSFKAACEQTELSLRTNLTTERNACDSNIGTLNAASRMQLSELQLNCSAAKNACNTLNTQLQNSHNLNLEKKKNECDSSIAALKRSFAEREKSWTENRICRATIREIGRRRNEDCRAPRGSENGLKLSTGFYYFSKPHEVVNWFVADANCKIMGMQLATIETWHENNAIINHLNTLGAPNRAMFWISGTDLGAEGRFVWTTTGQPIIYRQFHGGQPDNMRRREHCLQFYKVGFFAWNDYECDKGSRYICELQ